MSESIDSIRTQLWEKMRGKSSEKGKRYRDNFVAAHLSANIAAQIQTMRESRGWMQKDLATKADMSPARISVMENPSYENLNLKTLRRLASALDVALVVKFAAFSELVNWIANLSPEKLNVPSFLEDSLSGEEKEANQFATAEVPQALGPAALGQGAFTLGRGQPLDQDWARRTAATAAASGSTTVAPAPVPPLASNFMLQQSFQLQLPST
jgi:transcriptional regulator with XRE-family HTH domain